MDSRSTGDANCRQATVSILPGECRYFFRGGLSIHCQQMSTISDLSLVELRRDLHKYPETGWREFRTTALVAEALEAREFTVALGGDAIDPESRLGVPEDLEGAKRRAREEGAPPSYLERMGEITGLVASKRYGDGPVVGVRVDMDALQVNEASDDDHFPAREGFTSRHPGKMHACGHDGHTAIGIGVTREIDDVSDFNGTLKLFFQPAEEGGRGGKPMSQTSMLEDVEYFVAVHLGLDLDTGTIIAGREHPLPNTKLDVQYSGRPSHSGHAPNEGRNALQAMATAISNLYGIARHSDGVTRINVGEVSSPNPQNVIADDARMRVEVRGETPDLETYMTDRAKTIVNAAAEMHDVEMTAELYGQTTTFEPDESMVRAVSEAADHVPAIETVIPRQSFSGSEDASFLIREVQRTGGEATYIGIGASNPDGHHTARFDVDERALRIGVDLVTRTIEHCEQPDRSI